MAADVATVNAEEREAAACVTEACASAGVVKECTARAAGGDDVDGEGGGEAATGWTITDEAASVLEAACAACDRGQRRRGRGVVSCGAKIATWTFTEEAAPTNPCKL